MSAEMERRRLRNISRAEPAGEDELYLHTIPYLQFPQLIGGKPVTGERVMMPGVPCLDEKKDFWTRHMRAIRRRWTEHPEGPHSYGWWDACPGRPDMKARFCHWLDLYRPLVSRGTWAYLEIADSDLFRAPLPHGIVASVYVNQEFWLVLANYGPDGVEIETRDTFYALATADPGPSARFRLPSRSLRILRLHADEPPAP